MAFNRDLSQLANFLEVNSDGTFINIIPSSSETNLGIGTNNPTAKLDVLGNARVSGNLSATNINASGIVTATSGFVGNLTGTATSTTNIPNLTGDITSDNKATTLATVNSNVGSFGSQTLIPVVTVNAKGLVTAVTTAAVGTALTVSGDSGSENIDLLSETLTISGGTNLTSSAASNTVTVNLDPNISLTSVVASGVVTATSGFVGDLTGNVTGNINSSGVSTVTSLIATNINASGIITAAQFVTGASGSAIGINTNTISGPATITIDPAAVGDNTGLVVIKGDLQIDGTTTTINSTTITVDDKNIQIADGAANDAAADGAGITITSGDGNKTFQFQDAGDNLGSSENLNVASGKVYKVNNTEVLSSNTLGSGVVNSSLTSVGTLTNLSVGNVNSSGIITATTFVGALTGNVTGDINSSGVSTVTSLIATNINASGIVTATNGFVGNLTGLASSATQLQTSRDFSISGDATASSISFNGTANVGLALTLANTAVTPGSYGSSTEVATFTVDSKGRLTAAGTASVGTALTVAGDSGSENISLLSEVLTISGGTNLNSSAASNSVTVNLDDNISLTSVVASGIITAAGGFIGSLNVSDSLTANINSSGVSTFNSLNATNINASGIVTATSGFVGNLTGTAATTTNIPNLTGDITSLNLATTLATVNPNVGSFGSQTLIPVVTVNAKGLVTAVTTAAVGTALTVTGDSGSENIDLLSESLTISGGTNLNSSAASNSVTVNLDDNISLTSVVASGVITATSGFVGNVTGNLTGNVTGDINSSGVSTVTSLNATNINASGIVTATSGFSGNLTGEVNAAAFDTNASGVVVTGIATATTFVGALTGNVTGNINSSGVSTVTNLNIGGYVSIGNTIGAAGQIISSTGVGVSWKTFEDLLPQTRTGLTTSATASQTLFSFVYNVNFLDVFVNGVKLSSGEFTASNGTTITLAEGAFANDTVEFVSYNTVGAGTGQVSSLNDLTDVTLSGTTTGQLLAYNGSEFVNTSNINISGIITAAQFVTGASGVAIGINTNTISGPATITIDPAAVGNDTGLVVIKGDLQIDGTTTTVNSTTMTVDDINITLASGAANAAAANGAGITIDGASATLLYASTGDKWVFNKDVEAVDFNSTSDINLKENIRQVESASELVSKLEGVHFSWKETGKETIGVIAQQIEEHLPQLVQTGDTHKTVNYNGLIGVLIEAVKEQGAQIAALQAEIEELKK